MNRARQPARTACYCATPSVLTNIIPYGHDGPTNSYRIAHSRGRIPPTWQIEVARAVTARAAASLTVRGQLHLRLHGAHKLSQGSALQRVTVSRATGASGATVAVLLEGLPPSHCAVLRVCARPVAPSICVANRKCGRASRAHVAPRKATRFALPSCACSLAARTLSRSTCPMCTSRAARRASSSPSCRTGARFSIR